MSTDHYRMVHCIFVRIVGNEINFLHRALVRYSKLLQKRTKIPCRTEVLNLCLQRTANRKISLNDDVIKESTGGLRYSR